jgi:hypothetical protein
MSERWPALPFESWKDTQATLHRFAQIAGKIALARTPLVNHFWNAALLVGPRGLRTQPLPDGRGGYFSVLLDLVDHALIVSNSGGELVAHALGGCTVASLCRDVLEDFTSRDIELRFNDKPQEIAQDAIPLLQDVQHATYVPEQASAWHRIVLATAEVMSEFRARFVGKCSPVHFWWGAFDLAVTRFSGRRAPPRSGLINREAYSHECQSVGLWPGMDGAGGPWFYAYTAPKPEGLERAPVLPADARWHDGLGEHLLSYEAVRTADEPERALLDFFQSTYVAGASLARWDRRELERQPAPPPPVEIEAFLH